MVAYGANPVDSFPPPPSMASARLVDAGRRAAVGKPLSEILYDTAAAISRPVLWVLEILVLIGLGASLTMLPIVQQEQPRLAFGMAAGYFTLSSWFGGYLLCVGKGLVRRKRV